MLRYYSINDLLNKIFAAVHGLGNINNDLNNLVETRTFSTKKITRRDLQELKFLYSLVDDLKEKVNYVEYELSEISNAIDLIEEDLEDK